MTKKNLSSTIILGWAVAGTFDMAAAVIQTLLNHGDPLKMLQFIASGVFGNEAFTSITPYALFGVLFHYVIALGWTLLLFFIYPRFKFFSESVVMTSILYGLFVWFVMNRIVLPLSNCPAFPFVLSHALIGAGILIMAIATPLTIIAKHYYTEKH